MNREDLRLAFLKMSMDEADGYYKDMTPMEVLYDAFCRLCEACDDIERMGRNE
jgi:hypothetical protein